MARTRDRFLPPGTVREARSTAFVELTRSWAATAEVQMDCSTAIRRLFDSKRPLVRVLVSIHRRTRSTRQFSFTGTVVEFEPERKLAWTGGTFPILVGRHFFEFVPMRDGKTQVIQGEEFRGLYPLFAGRKKMLALSPAYEQFNRELADRAAHRHE